jgi:hypothetical protein
MKIICGCMLLSVTVSCSAFAFCNQPQPRLVCAEYFASQVVVEAKLVESRYVPSAGDVDGHTYEMQTESVLRGNIGEHFKVWEENSSGRATFDWKTGTSYLLFFYAENDIGWILDGCGNSGPLEKRQPELREIEALQKRHGGMIQVALGGDSFAWSPVMSGAQVNARGTDGTFSATTNDKGIAEIHVPPGQYSVAVENQQVVPYDLSFEDPRKILIENGTCAQIQFVQATTTH